MADGNIFVFGFAQFLIIFYLNPHVNETTARYWISSKLLYKWLSWIILGFRTQIHKFFFFHLITF